METMLTGVGGRVNLKAVEPTARHMPVGTKNPSRRADHMSAVSAVNEHASKPEVFMCGKKTGCTTTCTRI
ncbi:hypothetical protein ACTJLC_27560 [Paraburkholderia sp. 22099]|jgi:hypothetical protein|uniref:hypothetical protein n=1 Tax=Paraburkholderia TaxID=1822464 RepID=UPI00285CDE40|nr:hypothetical protein [Paraburkholderia terricola]MDR6448704.1 hypothetical protein [Paraburkholderia terricola]MDR6495035.1 hypothetical protein [Paraburkholderia terricola]